MLSVFSFTSTVVSCLFVAAVFPLCPPLFSASVFLSPRHIKYFMSVLWSC